MLNQFSRLELAIGKEGLDILKNSTVAILGVGGVGSFSAEALVRSGVGKIILIDKDEVDITNVNRQIHATLNTVGEKKVDVMKERMLSINPECEIICMHMFYTEETYELLFEHNIDFVVDASDTLKYKVHVIKECLNRNIQIISSMGAANKLDPTQFKIANIWDTQYDPLARFIRKELRKAKISAKVPVVYSEERPLIPKVEVTETVGNKDSNVRKAQLPPSSNAFVPSVAGLICASYVVNQLMKDIQIDRVQ